MAFAQQALEDAGVAFAPVPPRYHVPYFSHIMGGYSASYHSYNWSDVLNAESVDWFKESGDLKRANGDHFREALLSKGRQQGSHGAVPGLPWPQASHRAAAGAAWLAP